MTLDGLVAAAGSVDFIPAATGGRAPESEFMMAAPATVRATSDGDQGEARLRIDPSSKMRRRLREDDLERGPDMSLE